MNFWKKSLVLRLAGSFFLLSLLLVSLMGWSSYLLARYRMTQAVYTQLNLAAELKRQTFHEWVEAQQNVLRLAARLPGFAAAAERLVQSAAGDASLEAASKEEDFEEAYEALRSASQIILEEKKGLQEIFLISGIGGKIIFSTQPDYEGQHQLYETYYQKGLLGPAIQIGPFPPTLQPAITLAVPLHAANGKTIGVLAANLSPEKMDAILQNKQGMDQAIQIYLVNENNQLISAPGTGAANPPGGLHSAGIDAALRQEEGQGLYQSHVGEPVLGVYRAVKPWKLALLTEIDQQTAVFPSRQVGWIILVASLGLLALMTLGSYWLARRTADPILRILQAADAAADGDLSIRAPLLTQDEIGYLANAFNMLTARLNSAYQQLRSSEEHFRLLTDNVSDLITIIDADWTVFYASPSYENVLGYFPSELIGKSLCELMHSGDHQRLDNLLNEMILSQPGAAPPFEMRLLASDGNWLDFEIIANNRLESDDPGVILVGRNITDRKQSEACLHTLNAQLEERMRQRTAELEVANRELEAFSYSIAHDLRTPLRSISGYAQILRDETTGRLDENSLLYVDNILQAAQRMTGLIYDLLRLARVTRSELHRRSIDLSHVAQTALDTLRQRDPQRQVETIIQPGLNAHGDPSLLRILLENLLDNAWKFTRRQEQPLIEFGAYDEGGKTVYFVKDNGAGFDMAYSDKLFGTFERLHRQDEFEGAGMGLATARRIVRRHGGHIWAHGEVNKGAEFYFKLEL